MGVIHRLDKPVGGVMVYGKTKKAAAALSDQIRAGKIRKMYMAVVCGRTVDNVENFLKTSYFPPFLCFLVWITWISLFSKILQFFTFLYFFVYFVYCPPNILQYSPHCNNICIRSRTNTNSITLIHGIYNLAISHIYTYMSII